VSRLESDAGGLGAAEARRRLEEHGPNTLPSRPPPTLLQVLLHQLANPLIYLLIAAGVVSLAIDHVTDAIFIFVVIAINAAIGTVQEWKAERSTQALQEMLEITARVRRDGTVSELPAEELVPGDVILLEAGARVPADLRLLKAASLAADESLLTGESQAVGKGVHPVDEDTEVVERTSLVFAASSVTAGRGEGIVIETGARTEVGKIAQAVTEQVAAKPPLVVRMDRFTRQLAIVVVGASAVVALIALRQGTPAVDVFFLAVALAVAAIPEGLPVAMTVVLSIATSRMAARQVIVRRLTAVEGLGSCTLIASDKTGTLTVNRQTVRLISLPPADRVELPEEGADREERAEAPDDPRLAEVARAGVLCNEAELGRDNGRVDARGDAIDVALIRFAETLGQDPLALRAESELSGEIPFAAERRYAAAFLSSADGVRAVMKGAAEVVLPRCARMAGKSGPLPVDQSALENETNALAADGYRVLAIAAGDISDPAGEPGADHLRDLTLLGLVATIDPLRPEAGDAVRRCRDAGITVAMVTGDHPATALAIARELAIASEDSEIVTGSALAELERGEREELDSAIARGRVFARVTPSQKLTIVDSLSRRGHFVAVTGDGINDAPALRRASIGVAMGSGADVVKDTAAIIVADDNFASIAAGVEEGRYAYDNLRKVTYLLVSTGAAEVLLFLGALVSGLPLPLTAVQLLWLNLVTNGIQDVALAFEPGEGEAMKRKPRPPTEGIFNPAMLSQVAVSGVVMAAVTFGLWTVLLAGGRDEFAARNLLLLSFVLLQNFHVFNCRSERRSVFGIPLFGNPFLILAVPAVQGLHILAMYLPFMREVLQVQPILVAEWLSLLALAASILVAMEIYKAVRRRLERAPSS
jgi:magnesium-transporting ATPase (P-type)